MAGPPRIAHNPNMRMFKRRLRATGFPLALAVLQSWAVPHAHADELRDVVINGERVAGAQLQSLDGAHCGRIPDGKYWLSPRTGLWGYAGSAQPQGHISDPCRKRGRPNRSARGLHIPSTGNAYGHGRSSSQEKVWREDFDIGTSTLPHATDDPQEH